MSIGNLANSMVRNKLKKTMGNYSQYAMAFVGGPLDQLTAKMNKTSTDVMSKIPGARQRLGGVSFESQGGIIPANVLRSGSLRRLGAIVPDGGEGVPEAYKMKIESTNLRTMVIAIMQDKTSFRVTSDWEPFLPMGATSQLANVVTQVVSKKSLVSRFMTRRIWKGTTPVTISMTLIFVSIYDAYTNVVAPAMALMQMALPSESEPVALAGFKLPLLSPPGPSPFAPKDVGMGGSTTGTGEATTIKNKVEEHLSGGDRITINVGTYLEFDSVIIKDVQPVFDTKFDVNGWPVRAEVNVTFESYEILTKQGMEKVIQNKS